MSGCGKWDVFQCMFHAKVVDNFAVKEWGEMSKLSSSSRLNQELFNKCKRREKHIVVIRFFT